LAYTGDVLVDLSVAVVVAAVAQFSLKFAAIGQRRGRIGHGRGIVLGWVFVGRGRRVGRRLRRRWFVRADDRPGECLVVRDLVLLTAGRDVEAISVGALAEGAAGVGELVGLFGARDVAHREAELVSAQGIVEDQLSDEGDGGSAKGAKPPGEGASGWARLRLHEALIDAGGRLVDAQEDRGVEPVVEDPTKALVVGRVAVACVARVGPASALGASARIRPLVDAEVQVGDEAAVLCRGTQRADHLALADLLALADEDAGLFVVAALGVDGAQVAVDDADGSELALVLDDDASAVVAGVVAVGDVDDAARSDGVDLRSGRRDDVVTEVEAAVAAAPEAVAHDVSVDGLAPGLGSPEGGADHDLRRQDESDHDTLLSTSPRLTR